MWPDWSGQTAVIVASGPSAADVPLHIAKGHARFLAVKDGWKLCPWAEYLYACDHHWWEANKGVLPFLGQRICYDVRTPDKFAALSFLKVEIKRSIEVFRFDYPGYLGWGGNSGFHAINLAAQWGAKRLILVGFDMRVDRGNHFFGDHPYTHNKPTAGACEKWAKHLDKQASVLTGRGIEVINCSPVSALTAFPKMSLEAALEEVLCLDRV